MFGRSARHRRSDVSLVTEVLAAIKSARVVGAPIPVEQLPVAVGLANLHADVLSAMPLTTGTRRTPPVIVQPNPDESRQTTVHKLVQSVWWTGNGYALLGRDSITVLDPNRVSAEYDPDDPLRVAHWWYDGEALSRNEIEWIKLNDDPRYGPLGRSPLSMASEPLRMYGYAYAYLSEFFAGGGNPSTVLQRANGAANYDPDAAGDDWVAARQKRRPAVLPAGWTLQVPANNGELEAISRILEKCAAELARLVNAPPSLVNAEANGSMTYSTVAGEISRWLALSLVPTWITRLETFWSNIAGEPVDMDTDVMFRLVSPVDNAGAPIATMTPPRLEAVS